MSLICMQSAFFKAALKENTWKESATQTVELPDDNVEAFELYVHWLYARTIPSSDLGPRGVPASDDQSSDGDDLTCYSMTLLQEYLLLINAYILGDKIGDVDFTDAVIDVLVDCANVTQHIPGAHVEYVYEHTPEESRLRQWILDEWTHRSFWSWSKMIDKYTNIDVIRDIAKTLLFFRDSERDGHPEVAGVKTNPCFYHQHFRVDQPCYKVKTNLPFRPVVHDKDK